MPLVFNILKHSHNTGSWKQIKNIADVDLQSRDKENLESAVQVKCIYKNDSSSLTQSSMLLSHK